MTLENSRQPINPCSTTTYGHPRVATDERQRARRPGKLQNYTESYRNLQKGSEKIVTFQEVVKMKLNRRNLFTLISGFLLTGAVKMLSVSGMTQADRI